MLLESGERARVVSGKLVRRIGATAERALASRDDRKSRILKLESWLPRSRHAANGKPGGRAARGIGILDGPHVDVRREGEGTLDASSGFVPKIARTLGRVPVRVAEVPAPEKLRRRATVRDAVRAAIGASLHRLVANDPDVRMDADPEALHQARVATRRLRSDLRTFRPFLDRSVTEPLRAELQWLGSKLGGVRDADVLAELLRAKLDLLNGLDGLNGLDASSGDVVLRMLARQRVDAHDALLGAMCSPRYVMLLDRLDAVTRRPPVKRKVGKKRAATLMPRVVRRPWRHLTDTVKRLPPSPPDTELHEVRKRAKQARYAAEAAHPVVGRPAREFAKAMTRLQDVLGAHQDAVVARSWLHDAALSSDDRQVVYVAGQLAGLLAADHQARRDEWPSMWRRARRKRLRRWL